MDDIVINVDSVHKKFLLPHERRTTLKSHFVSALKGKKGRFETQHALEDISFNVKKGEFFGIVGRNGSGKSTLLKMLAGIYQPTKGEIKVKGKLVPFIELGVGFNPELTGRENVYLNGALLGFSEKEVDNFYDEVVEFAELHNFMDQKLKNYSSGMQVRLAFSMAVRARADILLIDEVLAVGDADFQRKCFEYFKMLKKEKTTVVFVSHDMNAVREYCDKAILIDNSRIKKMGLANDIAEKYLKLFSDSGMPRQSRPGSKKGERWGDGRAIVEGLKVDLSQDKLKISYEIKANDDLGEIVAGFRIRSTDGEDLTGTNTKKERQRIESISRGDVIRVEWQIPNIFSDGAYFVDPALVYPDEITVFDWWNEAENFSVNKYRNLPYPVDPGFGLKIERAPKE